jgi:hypothetical protein
MIDRIAFFNFVRRNLFDRRLSQPQVDGLTVILDAWERATPATDRRWLAYMLATAHHETGRTMQPLQERGTPARLRRLYDVEGSRPALARRMGNTAPGDGVRYCGRGYVQLTWKRNYALMSEVTGVDLIAYPARAMEPAIAATVMLRGMTDGLFTGKKLSDYFGHDCEEWIEARCIINGRDKARLIAGHAKQYYRATGAGA